MSKQLIPSTVAAGLMALGFAQGAQAFTPGVYFTEILSRTTSSNFFVEITNLTGNTIDLSGWGYDNTSSRNNNLRLIIPESIAPLAAGESLFITSACDSRAACQNLPNPAEPDFTVVWGLDPAARVVHVGNDPYSPVASSGFIPSSASGGDDLRLYNMGGVQVDRLVYTSTTFLTVDISTHIKDTSLLAPISGTGTSDTQSLSNWTKSSVGDAYGSYEALINYSDSTLEVGNPNPLVSAVPVPEPETYALMLAGLGLVGLAVRRRERTNRIHG
ncbi:MAG TPA: lamin tail domain-containing protein [Thiobacillaceae bacterium]|nr:lamin tail domain-containing protein [Thiobacillaceae bacterium]